MELHHYSNSNAGQYTLVDLIASPRTIIMLLNNMSIVLILHLFLLLNIRVSISTTYHI